MAVSLSGVGTANIKGNSHSPAFIDTDDDIFIIQHEAASTFDVWKSANNGTSFTEQNKTWSNTTASATSFTVIQSGRKLLIATIHNSSNQYEIQFNSFDMATETWATEVVVEAGTYDYISSYLGVAMIERSDGDLVIVTYGSD